jgi:hypothetical protein
MADDIIGTISLLNKSNKKRTNKIQNFFQQMSLQQLESLNSTKLQPENSLLFSDILKEKQKTAKKLQKEQNQAAKKLQKEQNQAAKKLQEEQNQAAKKLQEIQEIQEKEKKGGYLTLVEKIKLEIFKNKIINDPNPLRTFSTKGFINAITNLNGEQEFCKVVLQELKKEGNLDFVINDVKKRFCSSANPIQDSSVHQSSVQESSSADEIVVKQKGQTQAKQERDKIQKARNEVGLDNVFLAELLLRNIYAVIRGNNTHAYVYNYIQENNQYSIPLSQVSQSFNLNIQYFGVPVDLQKKYVSFLRTIQNINDVCLKFEQGNDNSYYIKLASCNGKDNIDYHLRVFPDKYHFTNHHVSTSNNIPPTISVNGTTSFHSYYTNNNELNTTQHPKGIGIGKQSFFRKKSKGGATRKHKRTNRKTRKHK